MTNTNPQTPLYEQVVRTIERQIMSGAYRKGDLLPSEKELTENLGVSRITVRKALSILSEMGIIETSKGRGSVVTFNIGNMEDHKKFSGQVEAYKRIFQESSEIRLMLEPEIAKKAAECATKEQVEYLKDCLKDEKADIHLAIASILQNQALYEIIKNVIMTEEGQAHVDLILPHHQDKIRKLLKEQHARIVSAIEYGDGEFAYFYMKEHTKYINEMYERYFEHLYSLEEGNAEI